MRRVASSLSVLLGLLSLSPEELQASDAVSTLSPKTQSLWQREYATGDWGGQRTLLSDRGVLFNFTYVADALSVVSGGIKRGTFYNGLLDLGTDIDFEKLVGWKGTHFHVNGFYPHGEDGSANYVGDIGTFSNIQAYDTYRLYELWVEQEFFDGRFSLRMGKITFDSEFAVLDAYGGLFVQSGFGAPEAFSANLRCPSFQMPPPVSEFVLRRSRSSRYRPQSSMEMWPLGWRLIILRTRRPHRSSTATERIGLSDRTKGRSWLVRSATGSIK
jgi:carbohydrate-selective porin OprB